MTLLTGPLDVDDAARTKFRMPRIAPDIAAQMKAAHALGLAAGFDLDPDVRKARGHSGCGRTARLDHARLTGDQQESELIAQRLEARGLCSGDIHGHLGIERSADLAGGAQTLEIARHVLLQADERSP